KRLNGVLVIPTGKLVGCAGAKIEVVSSQIAGGSPLQTDSFIAREFCLERGSDLLSQLVFDGQNIFHFAIVRGSPEPRIRPWFIKDRNNLDPILIALNAAFKNGADSKFLANLS